MKYISEKSLKYFLNKLVQKHNSKGKICAFGSWYMIPGNSNQIYEFYDKIIYGTGLSLNGNNNRIVIGDNVKTIKVSATANVQYQSNVSNPRFDVTILLNDENLVRFTSHGGDVGVWSVQSGAITDFYIHVNKGDELALKVTNSSSVSACGGGDDVAHRVYMTVEVIE